MLLLIMVIKENIQNILVEPNKIDDGIRQIYVSKLCEFRTIVDYTKYQDGFWSVNILYPLIGRTIWLGPHE